MLNPDFILIGSNTEESAKSLAEIYKQVNGDNVLIKYMGIAEAEIVKISINTFLTLKISFANTVGLLCNSHDDVDPAVVADAIGADTRIGKKYLKPGLGFGGPCLPRDTRAFTSALTSKGIHSSLSRASKSFNEFLESKAKNLVLEMSHDYSSIAFVGLSYKKGSWLLEDSHPFSVFKSIIAENERVIGKGIFCYDSSAEDITNNAREWRAFSDQYVISGGSLKSFMESLPESTLIVQCHELDSIEQKN